jgi:hypothetical protein
MNGPEPRCRWRGKDPPHIPAIRQLSIMYGPPRTCKRDSLERTLVCANVSGFVGALRLLALDEFRAFLSSLIGRACQARLSTQVFSNAV